MDLSASNCTTRIKGGGRIQQEMATIADLQALEESPFMPTSSGLTVESFFGMNRKAEHIQQCKAIDELVKKIPVTPSELPELISSNKGTRPQKPKPVVHDALRKYWKMPVISAKITWESLLAQQSVRNTGELSLEEEEAAICLDESVVVLLREDSAEVQPEQLIVFWKRGLEVPFGSRKGDGVLSQLEQGIQNLGEKYPPPPPKPHDIRHKAAFRELKKKHGMSLGVYYFAWWFATGQENASDPGLSAHILATSYKHEEVRKFLRITGTLQQIIGILFLATDPPAYSTYLSNFRITAAATAWDIFASSRRSCFHGLALLRNLRVGRHKDGRDRKNGWTVMVCVGKFENGYLVIPRLGLKFKFEPGDVIFFRASFLEHFLEEFAGQRSCFVFFTHAAVAEAIEQNRFQTDKRQAASNKRRAEHIS